MILAGAIVSFLAQWAEGRQKRKEEFQSHKKTEEQIRQANEVLKRLEEQGGISKQSLDALTFQTERTRTLLTNVEMQSVIAKLSLDTLSTQATQTEFVLKQLQHQNSIAEESRLRSEQLVESASLSLRYIENLLTPLDTMAVTIKFDLSKNSPFADLVLGQIAHPTTTAQSAASTMVEKFGLTDLNAIPIDTSASPPPSDESVKVVTDENKNLTGTNTLLFQQPSPPANLRAITYDVFGNEVAVPTSYYSVGFHTAEHSPLLVYNLFDTGGSFSFETMDIDGMRILCSQTNVFAELSLQSLTNTFWKKAVNKNTVVLWENWRKNIAGLSSPNLKFEFYRKGRSSISSSPDLIISGLGKVQSTSIVFTPTANRVIEMKSSEAVEIGARLGKFQLVIEFATSRPYWIRGESILSISDLSEGELRVFSSFQTNLMPANVNTIGEIDIRFKTSTVVLSNFARADLNDSRWIKASLPTREKLISPEDLK